MFKCPISWGTSHDQCSIPSEEWDACARAAVRTSTVLCHVGGLSLTVQPSVQGTCRLLTVLFLD